MLISYKMFHTVEYKRLSWFTLTPMPISISASDDMPLPWRVRLSYAVGHVLNDLCASVWFTYTLVFFKFGVGFPTTLAGSVVLIGQVADGLATPVVGLLSDRGFVHNPGEGAHYEPIISTTDNPHSSLRSFLRFCPTGRKAWHFWGSLLVILAFPLIFGSPVGTSDSSNTLKMIYYAPMVILFQIGWAAVQITHLALMNDLTWDPSERTLLTSLRHLFTVLSNLTVYLCTYFLLNHTEPSPVPKNFTHITPGLEEARRIKLTQLYPYCLSHSISQSLLNCTSSDDPSKDIDFGKDDLSAFRNLSLAILGAGGLMTVLFHLGVRQSDGVQQAALEQPIPTERTRLSPSESEASSAETTPHPEIYSWKGWLKLPLFWIQGFVYMTVRLIVNVSQAYITVYLLHSLLLPKETMALVPLTMYLASIATLLVQKPIQDRISRELNITLGFLFVASFCITVNYPGNPVQLWRVYLAAGLLGVGCTVILITSLAMVSDLIGRNHDNGAFVYGYMSFTDKLANGIVIQLIEVLWNQFPCSRYYQNVESYGIGGWVVAGWLLLMVQTAVKYRTSNRSHIILAP
ncbi:hypothetical protein T265_13341 [Opisthorchis viverrini]|uniref:Major facilitator superfamily domain-containing protein 12-like n=1 Tax=Opisthorchis viverrini TaxID=6198 RepID=A0A074ZUL0_OPIVI|nr:hypothetical protein T265_13341 [Opisthorchis viverrini]KER29532.1 hypothetical protein T265_13341 [Opisthorchis viverrini]